MCYLISSIVISVVSLYLQDKEEGVDDPCKLRLIFCGKQLNPEDKLSDCRITKGATIMVVQRLVGGNNTGEIEKKKRVH